MSKDVESPADDGLSSPALLSVNEDGPSETAGDLEGHPLEAKSELGSEVISFPQTVGEPEELACPTAFVDCKRNVLRSSS